MNRITIKNITVLVVLCCMIFLNCVLVGAKTTSTDIDKMKIDEFVVSRMKAENIPGVSIAIVKGDKIFYQKGYGKAGKGRSVTPQTPFLLGSVSKSFTALAIMQLVEKGKIDLNAPVVQYLPWFRLNDPEASKKITIQNLLSHTSGLSTLIGREVFDNVNLSIEELVRNQYNTKLTKPVGTTFQYSNLNYIILGEIIQCVSGESYKEYIKDNIFKPLGMKYSYADVDEAKKNGLASGYNSFLGFMIPTRVVNSKSSTPAGLLSSSAEDMSHYLVAEMNGGSYNGNSIISSVGMNLTHRALNKPEVDVLPDGKVMIHSSYAMGWFVSPNVIVHGGDTANFHSNVIMFKGAKWGIAVLYNSNDLLLSTITNQDIHVDILNGIYNVLNGKDATLNNPLPTNKLRMIINGIEILIFLLLILACYKLLRWKKKLKVNELNLRNSLVVLVLCNILIPVLFITILPIIPIRFFDSTTRLIITSIPDLGILIILVPLVLAAIGIVKLVLLGSLYRKQYKARRISSIGVKI